jgi:hypothetical protein
MPRDLTYSLDISEEEALQRICRSTSVRRPYSYLHALFLPRTRRAITCDTHGNNFTLSTWWTVAQGVFPPGPSYLHGQVQSSPDGSLVQAHLPHTVRRKLAIGYASFIISSVVLIALMIIIMRSMLLLGIPQSSVPAAILLVPPILTVLAVWAFIRIDARINTNEKRALISHLDKALDDSVVHHEQT